MYFYIITYARIKHLKIIILGNFYISTKALNFLISYLQEYISHKNYNKLCTHAANSSMICVISKWVSISIIGK